MKISPCKPYRSRTVDRRLCRLPDGKSAFKIYVVSIVGRDEPARYEWGLGPLSPADFEKKLLDSGLAGIGFVVAFPHIAKIFRFAPAMETVLHVRAFRPATLQPQDLGRDEGFVEFACYAEAAIAADEYHAWAKARTVEEYLEFRSGFADGPVAAEAKLAHYWGDA